MMIIFSWGATSACAGGFVTAATGFVTGPAFGGVEPVTGFAWAYAAEAENTDAAASANVDDLRKKLFRPSISPS